MDIRFGTHRSLRSKPSQTHCGRTRPSTSCASSSSARPIWPPTRRRWTSWRAMHTAGKRAPMPAVFTEQLELLYDLSRSLHALIEINDLLPFVVDKTKELLDAEGCSVILLDETGRELYFPYVSPESTEIADRLRQLRMPADKGI